MKLAETADAGTPVSLKGADVLIFKLAALSLALLLRLKPVGVALTASVGEARALTCLVVKEPGWFVLCAGALLHRQVADVHTRGDGTETSPGTGALLTPVVTEFQSVELVPVTLTPW